MKRYTVQVIKRVKSRLSKCSLKSGNLKTSSSMTDDEEKLVIGAHCDDDNTMAKNGNKLLTRYAIIK